MSTKPVCVLHWSKSRSGFIFFPKIITIDHQHWSFPKVIREKILLRFYAPPCCGVRRPTIVRLPCALPPDPQPAVPAETAKSCMECDQKSSHALPLPVLARRAQRSNCLSHTCKARVPDPPPLNPQPAASGAASRPIPKNQVATSSPESPPSQVQPPTTARCSASSLPCSRAARSSPAGYFPQAPMHRPTLHPVRQGTSFDLIHAANPEHGLLCA